MPEIFPWNPPLATGQWLTPQPVRDGPDPTPLQWPLAEPRMHRVLDKVPVGLAAADLQSGRFVFVNAFFCQLLGRRRDEFQNLRPMQIHPAEALPLVEADFAQLGAGMPPGPMVLPVLRGDGSQFMADIQRIPIELDGRAALLGIFTDISDRLQAQQALATSESHLRTLVDTIPDLIWLKDVNGVYLSCNPAFERFFGATEEAIVGQTDYDFVAAEQADFFRTHDLAAMAARQPTVNEEWITFACDGRRALLETTKVPMYAPAGELLGVLGISHDITERRRMQDELAMHRQHLETLVQTRTAELQSANHRLRLNDERLTAMLAISQDMGGLSEAELLQRGVAVAVRITASRQGDVSFCGACCAPVSGPPVHQVCIAVREHAQPVLQLCVAGKEQVYHDSDLQQLQLVGNDLWALVRRHRTEHALAVAKEAAEAASRTKSAFLSNMSHEIRTPLNAIIGFAQVLAGDAALGTHQLEQAHIIVQSGQHLLALINDVLDLSKIEAGKLTLAPVDFKLHDMLAELTLMFGARAETRGLQMQCQIQPEVPGDVCADESKLRQILINLLGNAIKFTPQGQVSLQARLLPLPPGAAADALRLCLEIVDTGPGIAPDDQVRLFQPFEQTRTGQQSGGTGLGLSICQRLVTLMGGEISLQSQPGQGSVFQVILPIARAATAPPQHLSRWHDVIGLAPGSAPVRLLVVDDMPDNRRLLLDVLRPIGFALAQAGDGQQALQALETWQPHAVLMDMRMPVMDGYEATRRIKALPAARRVPVIAVTASAFDDDMKAVFACGVDAFVRKPICPQELLEALAQVLGLRYLQSAARPAETAAAKTVTSDDLQRLPAELRCRMHQAVHEGDMARLMQHLDQVTGLDCSLSASLHALADSYQYEQLEALLAPAEPAPGPTSCRAD